MNNTKLRIITRAGILAALTVVFQYLGRLLPIGPNSNYIVGPLVNACLILSAYSTGLLGGSAVSIISVVGAILTGAALPLPLAPFIATGNLFLVLNVYFIKNNKVLGIILGAVLKFIVIWLSASVLIPLLNLPIKMAQTMTFFFSWPQLLTALLGGTLALIVFSRIKKFIV